MIPGELVNLRAVERTDAALVFRWFNDAAMAAYWGTSQPAYSSTRIEQQIEQWLDEELRLDRPAALIVETLDGEAIGIVVLSEHKVENRSAVISILIGESNFQERGFGSDALATVTDACFASWNLHRVILKSEASNARAHHVFEKCGFNLDATLRQASFHDGTHHDLLLFSKLATDGSPSSATAIRSNG